MYVASKPKLISSLIQVVSSYIPMITYEVLSLCRYGEVPKEAIPEKRTVESTLFQSEMQTRYMTADLCRLCTPMEMQSGGLHEEPFIMHHGCSGSVCDFFAECASSSHRGTMVHVTSSAK